MSDYQLLLALWGEYKAELDRRRVGEKIEGVYCGEKQVYKVIPQDKERIRRSAWKSRSLCAGSKAK